MIRIAVCDDNMNICSEVEQWILAYGKQMDTKVDVEVFTRGEELLNFIQEEHEFDLIFLDIELETTSGIEVSTTIRNKFDDHVCKIVFITSKHGYESQLFEVQPLNFLRKPIVQTELCRCITLSLKIMGFENSIFEYKKSKEINRVKMKDILYFEKVIRKTKIVTTSGMDTFNETLANVKRRLPHQFVESHGSYMVNFDKIATLKRDCIILVDAQEIPVSQRSLKTLRMKIVESEEERRG
ncbi:MAG: LytTR family DNA-binding domain-containing protein [Eubacteriales bacterium]